MTARVRTDTEGFVPRKGEVGEVVWQADKDVSFDAFPVMLRFADGETRSYREREVERAGDGGGPEAPEGEG
jgi:hypothetical protein